MSNNTLKVENPVESSASDQNLHSSCNNSTVVKILSIICGLLLISGATITHIYQVNTFAVYTLGGSGGVLILATVIGSIIHYLLQKPSSIRQSSNSLHIGENGFVSESLSLKEGEPLPKGWKKHQAKQDIIVPHGEIGVTILEGDSYFTYNGKIAIGWHGSYNPPTDMS